MASSDKNFNQTPVITVPPGQRMLLINYFSPYTMLVGGSVTIYNIHDVNTDWSLHGSTMTALITANSTAALQPERPTLHCSTSACVMLTDQWHLSKVPYTKH